MSVPVQRTIAAGITATLVMTFFMFVFPPMMGMHMNMPEMLANMLHLPLIVGWMIHLMMGTMFAFLYVLLVGRWFASLTWWLRGAAFGLVVYIMAMIGFKVMGAMGMMTPMAGMAIVMVGMLHIIYGIAVAAFFREA